MQLKFNGRRVFRTGQRLTLQTNPKQKEDSEVNANAAKIINQLAAGILARAKDDKDQERRLAEEQPGSPPPCILAKTETQTEVARHYESNTVHFASGVEAYEPPPVILVKED